MWFKKKDKIFEENIRQEKIKMKQAIQKAKLVAEFFSELGVGCVREDELKERLQMAKENNPEFFIDNADLIKSEMAKRKIDGMKSIIEVAKITTKDTLTKMETLKKLGKTALEYKK